MARKIGTALISVYHKDGLDQIVKKLDALGVKIYSTGGTAKFISDLGVPVSQVENLTGYPSILGGRVKTLHPKVFGGILVRGENASDRAQLEQYDIPVFDLVVVDLYPFEATVASGASQEDIIEKIDIGGISLIRAAAKNYADITIIPSQAQYEQLSNILNEGAGETSLETRKSLALSAFKVSSHYDTAITNYFSNEHRSMISAEETVLRYGENPHQQGKFYGDLAGFFDQLHGKALSYNNLLDIDAAIRLIRDIHTPQYAFAVLKHNNACGVAIRDTSVQAYLDALAGDPVSAFGGIIVTNKPIEKAAAEEINKLFCEVVIAPEFSPEALDILKQKKNRILLKDNQKELSNDMLRTALNGHLWQDADTIIEQSKDLTAVTSRKPSNEEINDLLFANILSKHTKSNTIVLAKNNQLLASGTGQTSRVDALRQAIQKASAFKFDLRGAVMASDAFFPFPDCVEIAHEAGIRAVIQPGGSIRDQDSIDFCNQHEMSMVTTGNRHFKH